jgi:ribonuclease BN (tRNA processing enzyme)
VRLTVIGSSPAWPNPGSVQSGYLVEGPGRLLLDCGAGVLGRLREREGWPRVDAIAITHLHLDHWGDLVPWVWGVFHLRGEGSDTGTPELWLPPQGGERLATLGGFLGYPEMFVHAFRVREYADGVPFRAAGFELTAWPLPHYRIGSYGFRVTDGSGAALAYSGDTGPSDTLVELARDVDLFLCEATLAAEEPAPPGHLTEAQAEAAFLASGAARLLLTHRPCERPLEPRFELAYDGLVVEIEPAARRGR